jgi:3-methyladenine DNA glycosylase AlkC
MVADSDERRIGARRPNDVPAEVLRELENGAESANHMEQIALDMGTLLALQFPPLAHQAPALRGIGLVHRMRRGGELLLNAYGIDVVIGALASSSDTVRGWGAMAVGASRELSLDERLDLIRPFAADEHFAVREWAWLSVRPHVASHLFRALPALNEWVRSETAYDRRFAIEVTRPRGVWSTHIPVLKRRPELAEALLEPVRADRSRYVQYSVGNWINDASKTSPAWAINLCNRWLTSKDAATVRICQRALRTVERRALSLPESKFS